MQVVARSRRVLPRPGFGFAELTGSVWSARMPGGAIVLDDAGLAGLAVRCKMRARGAIVRVELQDAGVRAARLDCCGVVVFQLIAGSHVGYPSKTFRAVAGLNESSLSAWLFRAIPCKLDPRIRVVKQAHTQAAVGAQHVVLATLSCH